MESQLQWYGIYRQLTVNYMWVLFPGGSAGKESTCNVGDLGLIPGLGRSPGKGKGYPLQYSGLENSMHCIQSMGLQRVGYDWVTFTLYTMNYMGIFDCMVGQCP